MYELNQIKLFINNVLPKTGTPRNQKKQKILINSSGIDVKDFAQRGK